MRAAPTGHVAIALLFLFAARATATVVGGGGSSTRDCLVALDAAVNLPQSRPKHVRCTDGDPSCDSDGVADGVCSFALSVCANSTFDPGCTLSGVGSIVVEHAEDNGDLKFDPDFQALQGSIDAQIEPPTAEADKCTTPTTIRVPIKGPLGNNRCSPRRKKVELRSQSQVIEGQILRDDDKIKFLCLPDPNACDPQILYDDTFDRIQRQIFNQNCALSGCHDSQSQAGNMLLETGASYGNLVNVTPSNFAASGAGWKRVAAANPGVSGSPDTSFIFHKITGELPNASYGARMPLNKPKLNKTLRDVIQLWIAAGAPQDGWVPGTD